MATSEGYGQRLAERLRVEQTPAIAMRVLRTADMAVTETRCDDPVPGLSGSIQRADAFFVNLTLRDYPNRVYWEDGRLVSVCDMRAGQASIHDLKRDPVALIDKPHHHLFFYLPRDALNAIADDANARRIGDLNYQPVGIDDTTISNLGRAILPALSHPDQVNQLFVDHVLLALPEVAARRDEILFAERIRRNIRTREYIDDYRRLVEEIISNLDPTIAEQIKRRPHYIETVGEAGPLSITRITREPVEGVSISRDYEFSRKTVDQYMAQGYAVTANTSRRRSTGV